LTRSTDTGNNTNDFVLACPSPTNNAGTSGSFGSCTPPTTTTSTTHSTSTSTSTSTSSSTSTSHSTSSSTSTTSTPTSSTTTTTLCLLDVDANGVVDVPTDIVYIARHLLGLRTVPPSFGLSDAVNAAIAARVDAAGNALDVDHNSVVDVPTDIVYIARHLLGLRTVPPSFGLSDAVNASIAANIDALCPR